jgi:hypothetical protein
MNNTGKKEIFITEGVLKRVKIAVRRVFAHSSRRPAKDEWVRFGLLQTLKCSGPLERQRKKINSPSGTESKYQDNVMINIQVSV